MDKGWNSIVNKQKSIYSDLNPETHLYDSKQKFSV